MPGIKFLLLLALVGAVACTLQWLAHRRWDGDPPPAIVLALNAGILAVFSMSFIPIVIGYGGATGTPSLMMTLSLGITILGPALGFGGLQVSGAIAEMVQSALFDSSIISPAPNQYGRARTLAVRGDFDGAIREFENYYAADRSLPTPLFAAAALLERRERFADAASMYQRIMSEFGKNRPVWAEAALRLATLREQLNNPAGAAALLRDVLKRARRTPQAREAANRVMRRGQPASGGGR